MTIADGVLSVLRTLAERLFPTTGATTGDGGDASIGDASTDDDAQLWYSPSIVTPVSRGKVKVGTPELSVTASETSSGSA